MNTIGHLRPIEETELELMLAWRNAPGVRQNMYTRHEISREEHLSWWVRTRELASQQYFMYEYRGQASGIVAFTGIDRGSLNCSWAFYASPDAPRGTGSRMEFLALEHVFTNMGLHKLYCEVLAFNAAVIKLHQKFGFEIEGVFKEHHRTEDAYTDIYRFGLLSRTWQMKREELLLKVIKTTES